VLTCITIEQAAVALAAVAMAITRLLIKNFLDARGHAVGVLGNRLGEERRTQGRGQWSRWHRVVKGRNGFGIYILSQSSRGPRRSLLWNQHQTERRHDENDSAKDSLCSPHIRPPNYTGVHPCGQIAHVRQSLAITLRRFLAKLHSRFFALLGKH